MKKSIKFTYANYFIRKNYSRKFELEADKYALDYMLAHNMDANHFATILQKITGQHDEEHEDDAFSYLSTHTATQERIQPFIDNRYSQ